MTTLTYCAGFDTETTGVDVHDDRIVTSSIVYVDGSGDVIQSYEWLINPGIEIPEEASNIHGITTDHAIAYGEQPKTALYEIAGTLAHFLNVGVPVVAYNAAYDFSILNAELIRHLGEDYAFPAFFNNHQIPPLIIDPLVIDKHLDKYRKGSRKLETIANLLGVKLEAAHTSEADSLAAAHVAQALWKKYPDLSAGNIHDSYGAQQVWYREQQLGMQAHFARQGKTGTFNTEWPIQRRTA